MSTKYTALLTQVGAARLANAIALGKQLEITQMGVGDAGGTLPTPDAAQTKLINEKRRAPINSLSIDPANANQVIAEQVIPDHEGGFWLREIGLYDADDNLVAVANCPETYKPQMQEGSSRVQTVRMILAVGQTDAVSLKIDPAVVLASRQYVDNMADGKLAKAQNGADIANKAQFIENLGVRSSFSGVIGMTRNATMNIPSVSSNARFVADEIIVGTSLGGSQYRIGLFEKTIDLTKTGVGGMDTGTVPDEGFVGIYAIYNPATMASGLLAVNATSVKLPEIYNGTNMPDGYTASALLTVVPVKEGKFIALSVLGRQVHISAVQIYSGSPVSLGTDAPISGIIPLNARTVSGVFRQGSTADGFLSMIVASGKKNISSQQMTSYVSAGVDVSSNYSDILIVNEGYIVVFASNATSGNATFSVFASKYSI
ncbi:phage tail protein [Dickeya solani]|uniref:Phage tail protein n=2 Tax=Dickeya solani TaxID=1089444 RepID=A0ABU4EJ35_9GAMM|nr:phage tail protein [Dickeya solani]MCA7000824.1 phage tail protein [Dickeya solani]MCZ0821834.1 phage tail protein [Dickeya solani]MDV6995013.1 phage tail protein [Dickeya solani]MDV7006432.1 phage tail protein [Dickeya solani]MDV7036829.1 phage tail protein [Dickeya solani]